MYDSLPEPSEDEEDMLDMAFGLTETSRLGCQITVTEDMEGVVLEMPSATRNFYGTACCYCCCWFVVVAPPQPHLPHPHPHHS